MRAVMRIALDFKGNLENYREEIDATETKDANDLYYARLADLNGRCTWSDLLSNTFEFDIEALDAALIQEKVEDALAVYREVADRIQLKVDDGRYSDPHTCVQWVYKDGHWEVIYNYNLWANTYPKYELFKELGIQTGYDLKVKYRAVVSVEVEPS